MTNSLSRPGTQLVITTLTGKSGRTRSPITCKEETRLGWRSVTICWKIIMDWKKWWTHCQKITSCWRSVDSKGWVRFKCLAMHGVMRSVIFTKILFLRENFSLFLQEIAGMFSAVGMCEQAVLAFTKVRKSRTLSPILRWCTNYQKQLLEVQSPLLTCIPCRAERKIV